MFHPQHAEAFCSIIIIILFSDRAALLPWTYMDTHGHQWLVSQFLDGMFILKSQSCQAYFNMLAAAFIVPYIILFWILGWEWRAHALELMPGMHFWHELVSGRHWGISCVTHDLKTPATHLLGGSFIPLVLVWHSGYGIFSYCVVALPSGCDSLGSWCEWRLCQWKWKLCHCLKLYGGHGPLYQQCIVSAVEASWKSYFRTTDMFLVFCVLQMTSFRSQSNKERALLVWVISCVLFHQIC